MKHESSSSDDDSSSSSRFEEQVIRSDNDEDSNDEDDEENDDEEVTSDEISEDLWTVLYDNDIILRGDFACDVYQDRYVVIAGGEIVFHQRF